MSCRLSVRSCSRHCSNLSKLPAMQKRSANTCYKREVGCRNEASGATDVRCQYSLPRTRVVPSGRCIAANPQKRAKSGIVLARALLKAEGWSDLGRKVRSSWARAAEQRRPNFRCQRTFGRCSGYISAPRAIRAGGLWHLSLAVTGSLPDVDPACLLSCTCIAVCACFVCPIVFWG